MESRVPCGTSKSWGIKYRFDHVGELSDPGEAVSRLRDAVCLNPQWLP